MFENDDGTLSVHVELLVEPSASTQLSLLEKLSFWERSKKGFLITDNGRLYSDDYFFGYDWRDHASVLCNVLQDDLSVLRQLVFEDANVTVDIRWTGRFGAVMPSVAPEDLGALYFPGIHVEVHANWDSGKHKGDPVHTSLYVYGPDPDLVSQYLGKPSEAIRVGDPIYSRGEVKGYRKLNVWRLDSEDFCFSSDSFAHTNQLLERIGPPTPEWRAFVESTSADVLMAVSWYAASGQTEPYYGYNELKKIGSYCAVARIRTIAFEPDIRELKTE